MNAAGALFVSSYEFPGRYARWTLGFVNPPLKITGRDRAFTVTALNARGEVLLPAVEAALLGSEQVEGLARAADGREVTGRVVTTDEYFSEEERSRQPSLFSVVRAVVDCFYYEGDPQLGLYGAFGYDLTFQFEPVKLKHQRDEERDQQLHRLDGLRCAEQHPRGPRTFWELVRSRQHRLRLLSDTVIN